MIQPLEGRDSAILIVDDSRTMRAGLRRALEEIGHRNLEEASNGREGLEKLRTRDFDLVLLDLDMPEMDGRETLRHIKSDPALRVVPVIVISGSDHEANAIACIAAGAEDYLNKPFDPVLLRARVLSSIERKRLRDHDRILLEQLHNEKQLLEHEKARSERLLLNILPRSIKERLQAGEKDIADHHENVTIGFADIVGFSTISREVSAPELVASLDRFFAAFDIVAERAGVEKIKTIGDNFMFAAGVPLADPGHAASACDCALGILETFNRINAIHGTSLQIRIGLHSGPVVAGIIGKKKFAYDIWGDAVNIASRMESTGEPGKIHISRHTRDLLGPDFVCEARDAGFEGVLTKPLEVGEIADRLAKAMELDITPLFFETKGDCAIVTLPADLSDSGSVELSRQARTKVGSFANAGITKLVLDLGPISKPEVPVLRAIGFILNECNSIGIKWRIAAADLDNIPNLPNVFAANSKVAALKDVPNPFKGAALLDVSPSRLQAVSSF